MIGDGWILRAKYPEGCCQWCGDKEHEPNYCSRCNCGYSDVVRPMGVPIKTDTFGFNGRRSRNMKNYEGMTWRN